VSGPRRQRVNPLFELHWREADDHESHGGRTLTRLLPTPSNNTLRHVTPGLRATKRPFEQGFSMGGTGLEPVTPSLSTWRSRSRPFARVRSSSMAARKPSRDRTPERSRTNADPCHPCHSLSRRPCRRETRRFASARSCQRPCR
jgi:hypothetical protein